MMSQRDGRSLPFFSAALEIIAIPYSFLVGLIVGLVAPVAAIAAMVGVVRWLTGKIPFLSFAEVDAEGKRQLSISLVSQDRAGELFAQHKEQLGEDLGGLRAEIKALIEEARAEGKSASQ